MNADVVSSKKEVCPWCGNREQYTDPRGMCAQCKVPWRTEDFMIGLDDVALQELVAQLRETYRREREAHAANLREQQRCEAEIVQLRAEAMDHALSLRIIGGTAQSNETLRAALAGMIEAVRDVEISPRDWYESVAKHLARAYAVLGEPDPRRIAAMAVLPDETKP